MADFLSALFNGESSRRADAEAQATEAAPPREAASPAETAQSRSSRHEERRAS